MAAAQEKARVANQIVGIDLVVNNQYEAAEAHFARTASSDAGASIGLSELAAGRRGLAALSTSAPLPPRTNVKCEGAGRAGARGQRAGVNAAEKRVCLAAVGSPLAWCPYSRVWEPAAARLCLPHRPRANPAPPRTRAAQP